MAAGREAFEILLAEDNAGDAELVRMALEEHRIPCTLRVVCDGANAIELLDRLDDDPETPPLDLLLVDLHLPKRNGEEVLKHLRSTTRSRQTPVVIITGLNSPRLQETAAKDGEIVYFTKPSSIDEYMQLGAIARNILVKTRGRT